MIMPGPVALPAETVRPEVSEWSWIPLSLRPDMRATRPWAASCAMVTTFRVIGQAPGAQTNSAARTAVHTMTDPDGAGWVLRARCHTSMTTSTAELSDLPAAFDSLRDLRDRLGDRDTILLRPVAVTERDRPRGPVVLAGDEHERHLRLLGGADLLREPVVRGVDLDANPLGLQAIGDTEEVVVVLCCYRDPEHLDRSQPRWERTGVVLGQHGEEPLDRPEQRTVDHDRALPGAVVGLVLELETLRQVEVHLDGRHLPGAADRVAGLDRDLRTVERSASRVGHQVQPGVGRRVPERFGGLGPVLVRADVLVFVSGRNLEEEVVQAVVFEQVDDKAQQGLQLGLQLCGSDVDVGVVLSHPSDPGQAMHHP